MSEYCSPYTQYSLSFSVDFHFLFRFPFCALSFPVFFNFSSAFACFFFVIFECATREKLLEAYFVN